MVASEKRTEDANKVIAPMMGCGCQTMPMGMPGTSGMPMVGGQQPPMMKAMEMCLAVGMALAAGAIAEEMAQDQQAGGLLAGLANLYGGGDRGGNENGYNAGYPNGAGYGGGGEANYGGGNSAYASGNSYGSGAPSGNSYAGGTSNNYGGGSSVNPAYTGGNRSAQNLSSIIDGLNPQGNPQYLRHNGNTYCNVFAQDVTARMGAPLPRLNANQTVDWLHGQGQQKGWRQVSAQEAQQMANQGKPAIAIWKNHSGPHGHVGVIRPGEVTSRGPAMAQAGGRNFNNGHVRDGFGANKQPEYWVHN